MFVIIVSLGCNNLPYSSKILLTIYRT